MLSLLAGGLLLGCTLCLFLLTVTLAYRTGLKELLGATTTDHFISARKTQTWFGVGLSLYAGAVGMWCLNTPPETAATDGCWALIGYAIACGTPWLAFLWSGKQLRRLMGSRGFTSLDFLKERYGSLMHALATLIAIFYLLVNLTSELTAVGGCFTALLPDFPPIAATLSIAIITSLYSAIGGLPASLLTDRVQSVATLVLVVISYSAVFASTTSHVTPDDWAHAVVWPSRGLVTAAVLIFSCVTVEQVNQATWQRVFASKTEKDMMWGFVFGVALMTPSLVIFGLPGIFAKAADHAHYIDLDPTAAYQSLFLLLGKLPDAWAAVVIVLGVGIVTSTADTIQAGLAAIISGELVQRRLPLYWARIFSFLLNIPPVIIASFNRPSILQILVMSSSFGLALVPQVWLGFSDFVTPESAVSGLVCSLLSILICGLIFTGDFNRALTWATFAEGYDWRCFLTFFVIVTSSAIVALVVAQIQFWWDPSLRAEQRTILEAIYRETEERSESTLSSIAADVLSPSPSKFGDSVPRPPREDVTPNKMAHKSQEAGSIAEPETTAPRSSKGGLESPANPHQILEIASIRSANDGGRGAP